MTSTAGRTRAPAGRGHAVVVGASMAGLLAARVLADTYQRVTVAADPMVGQASLHVANLIARPERLLTPGFALRVLKGNLPHVRSATGSAVRCGRPPLEVARR